LNQSEFLSNEEVGQSIGHARRELEFSIRETPGPGEYEVSDAFVLTQVESLKSVVFTKDRRTCLFEEGIDRDVPGPIYTPQIGFTSKPPLSTNPQL
jgi:hypothetical protein